MIQPSSNIRRKDTSRDGTIYKPADRPLPSPVTPAVTGLSFPTPTEPSPPACSYDRPPRQMHHRSGSRSSRNTPSTPDLSYVTAQQSQSSEDDSAEPTTPVDYQTIDQLWGNIRLQKEKKMAKDPCKIKSFEVVASSKSYDIPAPKALPDIPILKPSPEPKQNSHTLKRRKSIVTYRETDTETTVMFDLQGIHKDDVHVSYQGERIMVNWQVVEELDVEEEGHLVRERRQRIYSRRVNVMPGTRLEHVKAAMGQRHLVLRCAKPHSQPRHVEDITVDEY